MNREACDRVIGLFDLELIFIEMLGHSDFAKNSFLSNLACRHLTLFTSFRHNFYSFLFLLTY